jgi:class 3 adenylate cyclase
MRSILEGVESAVVQAGLQARPEWAPPAICFLVITGYTRLTEERGDAAAASLAEQLARIVQRASARQGGKPVKWLGDGVMFHFPDAGPGVLAALEMVEAASAAGLLPNTSACMPARSYSEIGTVDLNGIAEALRLHVAGRGP